MWCVFVTTVATETQQCVVYCSAVTANNTKLKSVTQKCFYGEVKSPATMKRTSVFTRSARSEPNLQSLGRFTKAAFYQISWKNPSNGSHANRCGQTYGHDEASGCSSRLSERA